ncbi:uncharacterized protein EAE97_000112 [Botrytis byssoidea]|uniref:Uncharacterized protein n=1 Tax=Botrytis byssoidea TaxID=139641 RepID=A0A9P5M420_9HELO|nr:uncharacterized protein EAE97_000112 [Botrytis byssoidea]KAF7954853.1 hypothetical protein EAE97_000112 [Botrytis byssoidea]
MISRPNHCLIPLENHLIRNKTHYSTLSTMLSFIAFSHATAMPSLNGSSSDIVTRNANHVSLYTTSACATNTTNGSAPQHAIRLQSISELLVFILTLSRSNILLRSAMVIAKRYLGKDVSEPTTLFGDGDIGSIMFWLPAVCELVETVKYLWDDATAIITAAGSFA